jgi:hypothetical protein
MADIIRKYWGFRPAHNLEPKKETTYAEFYRRPNKAAGFRWPASAP